MPIVKLDLKLLAAIMKSLPNVTREDARKFFDVGRGYEPAFNRHKSDDHGANVALAMMNYDAAKRMDPRNAKALLIAIRCAVRKKVPSHAAEELTSLH